MIGLVTGYLINIYCVVLTFCQPISYMWHPVPGGSCKSPLVLEVTSVAISMFLDIVIVIMPMPLLWRLQMAARHNVVIMVMFSLSLL